MFSQPVLLQFNQYWTNVHLYESQANESSVIKLFSRIASEIP